MYTRPQIFFLCTRMCNFNWFNFWNTLWQLLHFSSVDGTVSTSLPLLPGSELGQSKSLSTSFASQSESSWSLQILSDKDKQFLNTLSDSSHCSFNRYALFNESKHVLQIREDP
ncbi:hypothetical protein NQ315_016884 [Exocentrus adspersus]|uniref:Uncharacterized protein n=1 Tax=Exocentrus adspersus TaxID=1586481 RepID=A0AAV8VYM4_9CUCU|nr:hypothetical protein NQ315_016884 [Exocentrus adspersus]